MLQEGILQYFRPSLSYHLSLRRLFCLFLNGHLRQVLLYFHTHQIKYLFFHAYLSSADFFSSKLTFSKNSLRNIIRMSNSLDPDQAQHFVGPDLDPNCLQMLLADDKCSR